MWIELTKERVIPRLSPVESSAVTDFDKARHAPGQDLLQEIIDAVVAELRAAIAACEKNRLDPVRTRIPESCLNDALSMIAYHVGTRVGIPVDAARETRYNAWLKARENLDKLRSCAITVEDPETGVVSPAGSAGARVVFTTPTRMDRRRWRF